jgi:hypothetical protein
VLVTLSMDAVRGLARTFASVLPRQSPSCLIFWSMLAAAESSGAGPFVVSSTLAPNVDALSVTCNSRRLRAR